jgi:hypothetical protein
VWRRFTREGFTGYEPKSYDIPLCPLRILRLKLRFFRVLCVPTYEERSRHSESEYPLSHPSGTAHFLKSNNKMADAEEVQYDNDCLVISIDIVDCPMAEIPLTEVFDVPTKSLVDNYHDVIRDSVRQQLEHTTWLSADLLPTLTDPGFGMYHARDRNSVIMLRKPALQRLINQRLKDRSRPSRNLLAPPLPLAVHVRAALEVPAEARLR